MASNKHITFCFGRFNPPNAGHAKVFDTVKSTAKSKGGDWVIFTSKSHDPRKNPLSYDDKLNWLYILHPDLKGHLVEDPKIKTYFQAAVYLYNKGYTSATFVAGTEDIDQMAGPLEKYNGVEIRDGYYNFVPLDFVTSPSPPGRSTDARAAALEGNIKKFSAVTGISDKKLALALMNDVREGMGVAEPLSEADLPPEGSTSSPIPGTPEDLKPQPDEDDIRRLRKRNKAINDLIG